MAHARATEEQLVERAKRGDHDAYAALVRPHEQLALRMSYLITRDAQEAEDAVQEALTKTYFALKRFRSGLPFRPWLIRIVVNEARDRRRAAERRRRAGASSPADAGTAPPADAGVLASEATRIALDSLLALREEERLVVACRVLLDLSEEETSELLGTALGTTKSRFSRARATLRERLGGSDA